MSILKKAFSLAFALLFMSSVSANAQMQQDDDNGELLFKIHDIAEVKDAEGEVIACEFNTTFYNRSAYLIKDVVVDFTWSDSAIQNVVEQEKREDMKANRRSYRRAASPTEGYTDAQTSAQVAISSLQPQKQTTIKNVANTKRCFLILENVDFDVKDCTLTPIGQQAQRPTNKRSSSVASRECVKLFKFVPPTDSQYYVEFKEISFDEEKAQEVDAKKKFEEEMQKIYKDAVSDLNSATTTLEEIKKAKVTTNTTVVVPKVMPADPTSAPAAAKTAPAPAAAKPASAPAAAKPAPAPAAAKPAPAPEAAKPAPAPEAAKPAPAPVIKK